MSSVHQAVHWAADVGCHRSPPGSTTFARRPLARAYAKPIPWTFAMTTFDRPHLTIPAARLVAARPAQRASGRIRCSGRSADTSPLASSSRNAWSPYLGGGPTYDFSSRCLSEVDDNGCSFDFGDLGFNGGPIGWPVSNTPTVCSRSLKPVVLIQGPIFACWSSSRCRCCVGISRSGTGFLQHVSRGHMFESGGCVHGSHGIERAGS